MHWAGTGLVIAGFEAPFAFQMPPQGSRTGSEAVTSPQPPWFTPVFSGSGGGGGSADVRAARPRDDAGALDQPPTVRGAVKYAWCGMGYMAFTSAAAHDWYVL